MCYAEPRTRDISDDIVVCLEMWQYPTNWYARVSKFGIGMHGQSVQHCRYLSLDTDQVVSPAYALIAYRRRIHNINCVFFTYGKCAAYPKWETSCSALKQWLKENKIGMDWTYNLGFPIGVGTVLPCILGSGCHFLVRAQWL